MLPILETNRENVLESIACFRRQLDGIEAALIRRDYQALGDVLEHGSLRRALLLGSQK
jgi:prephenate dehydrogenase